jgi:large subunit ribosomal protein L13
MKTSTCKPSIPQWVILDASGKTIGRLAVGIANNLRGKHRKEFSPHAIYGDHVVVTNVSKMTVHPAKLAQKVYHRHTGYPGHIRTQKLNTLFEKDPVTVLERAVKGMLPKNRLRAVMLKRLHLFAGSDHPHDAQKPIEICL